MPDLKLTEIQTSIRDLLEKYPDGLDIHQIRKGLGIPPNKQENLSRRVRSLTKYYELPRRREGKRYIYQLGKLKKPSEWQDDPVSSSQRARILLRDQSTCQLCGRNVQEDNIKLHVDHKIPVSKGGKTEDSNLWSLCRDCNEGKKDYVEFSPLKKIATSFSQLFGVFFTRKE